MEGTLDFLEAQVGEIFAGVPILLRLLMRLFAMLRDRMGPFEQVVLAPVVVEQAPVEVQAVARMAALVRSKRGVRKARRVVAVAPRIDAVVVRAVTAWRSASRCVERARMGNSEVHYFSKFSKMHLPDPHKHAIFVTI